MAAIEKNASGEGKPEPIIVKKYANRRLYNTATSSYVTLDYLSQMVKSGVDFVVKDAKSGDDITRSVLTQIIFEEEAKGQNLLPIDFLRKLIRMYGDSMQAFVPSYLEMSMDAFTKNRERMREQMSQTFGAAPGYRMFEEQVRQNTEMFDNAMRMFAPFAGAFGAAAKAEKPAGDNETDVLRQEIELLKRQLAEAQSAG
ncbi:MAG: polyhydroxyalkanoate synthesis repressor PhaR [Pseudomonadota bacterium]